MSIRDAVFFVTGSNRGLGAGLIKQLKQTGARKIYAASRHGWIDEAGVINVKLDITKPDEVRAAAAWASDTTVLINNAGINLNTGLLKAPDMGQAREEMQVNYFGTLAMCRAFASILRDNGGGTIVNIASILGRVGVPALGSLCASKAALISLTQAIRGELAMQGTNVILVMPGTIDTDMSRFAPPPKADPADVALRIIEAIQVCEEEVYPDAMAQHLAQALMTNPKNIEKQFALYLP